MNKANENSDHATNKIPDKEENTIEYNSQKLQLNRIDSIMKSQISKISTEELNDNKVKHATKIVSNKKQAKKIEFRMIKDKEMKKKVQRFD